MLTFDESSIIPADAPNDLIVAAGGILIRVTAQGLREVACVYRAERGDWTFPKGKLDAGETFAQAALREVWEETGFTCHILAFAGTTYYTHRKGRAKIAAYFLMNAVEGEFVPNDEVDIFRWVVADAVSELLTWDRDKDLFRKVMLLEEMHAQAS